MTNSATGQKVFGSGYFYGAPVATAPTPTQFGATQDMSLDFKRDVKTLFGQNQLPIETASGKLTVSGKVNMATLNGRLLNDLMLGTSLATGETLVAHDEAGAIPASTPFTVTVAQATHWLEDLGVSFKLTNVPLTRVASAPATGQYSVAAGVYTFAAADTGLAVFFDYSYTSSTTGQSVTMSNQPMGKTGNFQSVMAWNFGLEKSSVQLNNCMSSGLSFATKLDDFMMPAFDYSCATDSSDVLGIMSFAEVN